MDWTNEMKFHEKDGLIRAKEERNYSFPLKDLNAEQSFYRFNCKSPKGDSTKNHPRTLLPTNHLEVFQCQEEIKETHQQKKKDNSNEEQIYKVQENTIERFQKRENPKGTNNTTPMASENLQRFLNINSSSIMPKDRSNFKQSNIKL